MLRCLHGRNTKHNKESSEIMKRRTLPEGLTIDIIQEAAEREMFGLDNPGFCLSCGEENDSCEPDARNYECDCCGEREVFGASELLMMFA